MGFYQDLISSGEVTEEEAREYILEKASNLSAELMATGEVTSDEVLQYISDKSGMSIDEMNTDFTKDYTVNLDKGNQQVKVYGESSDSRVAPYIEDGILKFDVSGTKKQQQEAYSNTSEQTVVNITNNNKYLTEEVVKESIADNDLSSAKNSWLWTQFTNEAYDPDRLGEFARKHKEAGTPTNDILKEVRANGGTARDMMNALRSTRGVSDSEAKNLTLEAIARGAITPFLGVGKVAEGLTKSIQDLQAKMRGRELTQEEYVSFATDYIRENKEEADKLLSALGFKKDEFSPFEAGKLLGSMVATGGVYGFATKATGTAMGLASTSAIEGVTAASAEIGARESTGKAVQAGLMAGASTLGVGYVGMKLINHLGVEQTNKLHTRLKEMLDMTPDKEQVIYNNYAKLYGLNANELSVNQKVTAIAYSDKNAEAVLDASLSKIDSKASLSDFNKFADELGQDLQSKIDTGNIVEIQKLVKQTDDGIKQGYKDFSKALDTSYGDIEVVLPKDESLVNAMLGVLQDIKDPASRRAVHKKFSKGQVGLGELHEIKVLLGTRASNLYKYGMNDVERRAFILAKEQVEKVDNLLKSNLPDDMLKSYKSLNNLYRLKSDANTLNIWDKFIKDPTNINQKQVDSIIQTMDRPRPDSSYSKFITVMGKTSEGANKLEGNLIQSILNSNTKDGFIDFVKVIENLDKLNFKTPQGKALKNLLSLYSEAFRNVKNIRAGFKAPSEESTLTLNPFITEAFHAKSGIMGVVKQYFGFGITSDARKVSRGLYVLNNLPKVLDIKAIPNNYSLLEQRGTVGFAKLLGKLQKAASQTSEEIELGSAGEYYQTSQFIGDKGARKLETIGNSDEAILALDRELIEKDFQEANKKGWEKTKWYFDEMDGNWKFHLNGEDVKLKMSKAEIKKQGTYKVKDIIDMPDLFKAYPELAEREVKVYGMQSNTLGGYNPHSGNIVLNMNYNWGKYTDNLPMKDVKGTLVHELQHAIQDIEEFATGSNTNGRTFNQYASSHGEVEARLTDTSTGEFPVNLYDEEYKTGERAYRGSTPEPLNKNLENELGKPVGSKKPTKYIEAGKRFRP